MVLEPVQVIGRDVGREVVRGRLDAVEGHVGGQVDEVEQVHLGRLAGEVLAVGIGGDAELEMAGTGPADRRDRPRRATIASAPQPAVRARPSGGTGRVSTVIAWSVPDWDDHGTIRTPDA